VHYQHLMMNGKKLAKSDGNVAFLHEVLEKGFRGEDLRLFFLQAHYRSFQDFTWEWLAAAQKSRANMIKKIAQVIGEGIVEYYNIAAEDCNDILIHQLTKDLADDLDTPKTLATWYAMLDVMNDEVIKAMVYMMASSHTLRHNKRQKKLLRLQKLDGKRRLRKIGEELMRWELHLLRNDGRWKMVRMVGSWWGRRRFTPLDLYLFAL
jgi:cysteinyl-tRNA synthetase